ncbi:hypothetical protein I6F07_04475 [Ensifer sp. IC4062]|nr:hypothetical protein [Ensifer sp. IC4062]MCA1439486.1 hypothetical protein [Ensifer sp. IC4062]
MSVLWKTEISGLIAAVAMSRVGAEQQPVQSKYATEDLEMLKCSETKNLHDSEFMANGARWKQRFKDRVGSRPPELGNPVSAHSEA